jgi:hypothetical protein
MRPAPGDTVGVWMRPEWRAPEAYGRALVGRPFEGLVLEGARDFDFESFVVEVVTGYGEERGRPLVEVVRITVVPALGDVILPRIDWHATPWDAQWEKLLKLEALLKEGRVEAS